MNETHSIVSTMNDLDCFLFVDMEVPEEQRTMSVLCVECHDEKMPDTGAFYNGSVEGYSNYDWKCCLCGKIIHKADEEYYEEESEASSEDERE
jgi:hypothetical protein